MTIPVWVLMGFAAWTLAMLFATVGVYRWSRILTRRQRIATFRADSVEGDDWYKRAMRAHANCVENLPVYGAIVLAIVVTGVRNGTLDALAIVLLGARMAQTITHVAFMQTDAVVTVRFSFFFVQAICMVCMGVIVALAA